MVRWSLKPNARCNALNSKTLGQQCAPCLPGAPRGVCFNTVAAGTSCDPLVFRILDPYRCQEGVISSLKA